MGDFHACGHFWKQLEWQVVLFSSLHLFSSWVRGGGGHSLDPVTVYWVSREPCDGCCRRIKRQGCKKAVNESSPQHVITHEMTTALQGGGMRKIDKVERERERESKGKQKSIASELLSLSTLRITCAEVRKRNDHTFNPFLRQLWANRGTGISGLNPTGIGCKQKKAQKHDSPLSCSVLQWDIWHNLFFTPLLLSAETHFVRQPFNGSTGGSQVHGPEVSSGVLKTRQSRLTEIVTVCAKFSSRMSMSACSPRLVRDLVIMGSYFAYSCFTRKHSGDFVSQKGIKMFCKHGCWLEMFGDVMFTALLHLINMGSWSRAK